MEGPMAHPQSTGSETDFEGQIAFRCPAVLAKITKQAAAREMTTPSAYLRSALLKQLRRDGIDPAQLRSAAA
jgi:hypothetical protein